MEKTDKLDPIKIKKMFTKRHQDSANLRNKERTNMWNTRLIKVS